MAKIRFLILSDTHDSAFPDHATLPDVDVILHCGDHTMIGGLSNFRAAVDNLSRCKAELKITIAGNHDISLDPVWWDSNVDEDDDPDEPVKARDIFTSSKATEKGIRFVDEGAHSFSLKDGRTFSIYASPYTPEFHGYAFAYSSAEDRFNGEARNPIPAGVDIVMTHGPPLASMSQFRLSNGRNEEKCGCPKLWEAIERTKPRLHCFGHIHEGYGAQIVTWGSKSNATHPQDQDQVQVHDARIEDGNLIVAPTVDETLLVNAALMTHGDQGNNRPWTVDLML